jgi:hypothetical protein
MTVRRVSAFMCTVAVMAALEGGIAVAHPAGCQQPPLSGGYGNAGFSAGYSSWIGGFGCRPLWSTCGFGLSSCGPCWPGGAGWCLPRRCDPWIPWSGRYGFSRSWVGESVVLSVPAGGGATFFSGGVNSFVLPGAWYPYGYGCGPSAYGGVLFTPYGTWLPAGYGPSFGPAGVFPFLNAFGTATAPVASAAKPQLAAVDRVPPVRGSNADARRRALKLVAVGDRHLRAAANAPGRLTGALDAYRRAATIAADLPDTFVRQAIVLVALGREDQARLALTRVTAIDPRIGEVAGDRGLELLATIASPAEDDAPQPPNWIAERWAARWQPGIAALAATAPAVGDPAVK